MIRIAFVVSFLLGWSAGQESPQFRAAPLFGDHMVLPAQCKVAVHGSGVPGERVSVQPSWRAAIETRVRGDGLWLVELETPVRGGRGSLIMQSGERRLTCDDVLFGDVWLASGQSNMEMQVGKVDDWQHEVATADWPELRVFKTRHQMRELPADQVDGSWVVCTPATAAEFSAVGYFFARVLLKNGKGPIGLVDSSWGGTRAEAWTSAEGLAAFPEFAGPLRLQRTGGSGAALEVARELFWQAIEQAKPELPAVDVTLPERWSNSSLADFDGVVDYTRSIELPAVMVGKDLWLELGAIDDMDTVFWNGERIAGSEQDGVWNVARRYRVPARCTAAVATELRVRVVDTGGEGGFSASPEQLRLVLDGDSPQSLPLAGVWQRRLLKSLRGLPTLPRSDLSPSRPAVLWNGMIAPLLPFPFTGVIWYQGESNRNDPEQYARLFPALIRDWRRSLGRELPFYFVQIAPYRYGKDGADLTARLREAQAAALALAGTGMVVTLDCGDADDIHPARKQPVGARLAALALARHYGEQVPCGGPEAVSARRDGRSVRVRFADGHGGLQLQNGGAGFEVADDQGRFVEAMARVDGDELVVQADAVEQPSAVRYAWQQAPRWSLCNPAGFPAAPFRLSIR